MKMTFKDILFCVKDPIEPFLMPKVLSKCWACVISRNLESIPLPSQRESNLKCLYPGRFSKWDKTEVIKFNSHFIICFTKKCLGNLYGGIGQYVWN